jgi:hypothetical protein
VAQSDDTSASNDAPVANEFDELPMNMNNPGSVVERLEEDEEPKDYLFQFPGVSEVLKPWYDWKDELDEKHGFDFGFSFSTLYQKVDETLGPEDEAVGFDLDFSVAWTFRGRGTSSPTVLGFNAFWRDKLWTDVSPQFLFTQGGTLYSNAAPYGEEDPVIGELWIQQKFRNRYGFRVGKIFPVTAYDFFPFKNFRTDFVDFNHVTNAVIPLPGNGLGAFAVYRPRPDIMLRLGAHDANADVQESGFDTYEKGELFKIVEVGYDTGLMPRLDPARPPFGHIHVRSGIRTSGTKPELTMVRVSVSRPCSVLAVIPRSCAGVMRTVAPTVRRLSSTWRTRASSSMGSLDRSTIESALVIPGPILQIARWTTRKRSTRSIVCS